MSRPNILVTGAGGGGSNNLIRGLQAIDYPGKIVGSNISRFFIAKSLAESNYVIPRGDEDGYFEALETVIETEDIDLILPNNGTEVRAISKLRDELSARVFLPPHTDIELCQDKYELTTHLQEYDIPVPESIPITESGDIATAFETLNGDALWCRLRRGSGSKGATKVRDPTQAQSWIEYWEDMRDVSKTEFTLNEYLPGRDYAFQSLWYEGELVLSKTLERLSYYFGDNRASGQSSTPQVGKLLYDETIQDLCEAAIRAVNPDATGMYSIDLKEDADDNPHVTEINIGRFCMITNAFNEVGRHNMADFYTRVAFDDVPDIENRRQDIGDETTYLIRELDTEPLLITESELERSYTSTAE
ncbi:MAG: ATP-grasp domain-containing protein [Halorientalis sp.]